MEDSDLIRSIDALLEERRQGIVDFLGRLIDLRGGSEDRDAVNRVGEQLAARFEKLGFSTERHTPPVYGDHLVFRSGDGDHRVVLAGHMDTTFTDYSGLPSFHLDGEHAVGPGTADMRGGLVAALVALEILHELGLLERLPVTVICNADEERGSSTSHRIFEAEAPRARCAMVFECAGKNHEIVIGRRGKLSAHLEVEGRAGHAADRSLKKASAIEEIAHKVIALEALNDGREGASFNVGLIHGGIAGNTFPRHASIDFDIRYLRRPDREWVEREVLRVADDNRAEGVRSTVEWTSARPVWEPSDSDGQAALVGTISAAAAALGQPFTTEFRYGTSDANFLAAAGVPTVDGMGPMGFADHTDREHIVLETLFERIRLTTLVLRRLTG
jgi:glutamate carboxypeptidase